MKKTYPVSKKASQWAKHLRKDGKRLANKSTRRLVNDVDDSDAAIEPVIAPAKKKQKGKPFIIECRQKGAKEWKLYRAYDSRKKRNDALEQCILRAKRGYELYERNREFRAIEKTNVTGELK